MRGFLEGWALKPGFPVHVSQRNSICRASRSNFTHPRPNFEAQGWLLATQNIPSIQIICSPSSHSAYLDASLDHLQEQKALYIYTFQYLERPTSQLVQRSLDSYMYTGIHFQRSVASESCKMNFALQARPMTHDLMKNTLTALGARVSFVLLSVSKHSARLLSSYDGKCKAEGFLESHTKAFSAGNCGRLAVQCCCRIALMM